MSLLLLLCCYKLAAQTQSAVVQLYSDSPLSGSEQSQIQELKSIKLSVRNKLILLEKESLELANEIVSKLSQLTRLAQEVKSTQKQLIHIRENLRVIDQLPAGVWTGHRVSELREGYESGGSSPIYIFGGTASEWTGVRGRENRTDCTMSGSRTEVLLITRLLATDLMQKNHKPFFPSAVWGKKVCDC